MKLAEKIKEIDDVIVLSESTAMFCRNDIVSIDGACCTLYPQKGIHTKEDIRKAKHKAKNTWDIVKFNIEWLVG